MPTSGKNFTKDEYFWPRPSAVDYHADGSGGSNKSPSNPDYLKDVEKRIRDFMTHNPGVSRAAIPAELVTASGSGLDPDLSPVGAKVQVARIARLRGISADKIDALIETTTEKPLLGLLGPAKLNVLKLNVALDELKSKN
jgi:K+-transporting ATPase ATPase C chain